MIDRSSNENFRLLDVSSEDQSDLELHIIPSRKKKITRRERSKGTSSRSSEINIETELQCAVRWAVRGTVLLWLLMLTWLCAALYDQVSSLRLDISKVSTSSNSVGDALQLCHTAAKELRANASELSTRLAQLERGHEWLAARVNDTARALNDVSGQLSAAPSLADTPRRLKDLQRTIADIGSQISGFDGALSSAKKQAATAASGVEAVKSALQRLEARTDASLANATRGAVRRDELRAELAAWNDTVLARVDDLQARVELMLKPASTAAPPPPTTPSTTTTTSTTTSTTVAPPVPLPANNAQGPPIKSIVLEGPQ